MGDLKGLDAWLVSGRYSWEYLQVECNHCGEYTIVKAEQEYGGVWWTPDLCQYCKKDFDDDVKYQEWYPEDEINV